MLLVTQSSIFVIHFYLVIIDCLIENEKPVNNGYCKSVLLCKAISVLLEAMTIIELCIENEEYLL